MRRTSIILAVASVVIPFACAYLAATALNRQASADGAYICALPVLGLFLLASLACVIISTVAFGAGLVAYRRLPWPRPRRRLAELIALALPLLVVGGYAASILFGV